MSKFICLLAVVSVSAACSFFAGQQTKSPANSASSISEDTKKSDFLKIFQSENIQKFQSWEGDNGKKFFGVIRQLNETTISAPAESARKRPEQSASVRRTVSKPG